MHARIAWGCLSLVVVFCAAIKAGPGPLSSSEGSFFWGSGPGAGVACDTPDLQKINCLDKNGVYCGVQWKGCRPSLSGFNFKLCQQGHGPGACADSACDPSRNPAQEDLVSLICTSN